MDIVRICKQGFILRHCLDAMHVEKNVCGNVVQTIFGMKDTIGVRRNMEEKGIRPHLWLF
jgi:hypothetical protein